MGRNTRAVAGPARCRNIVAGDTNTFPPTVAEQLTFSSRTVDVPAQAVVGRQDWGANRTVGGPMNIGKRGYTQFKGVHMVDRAGHWAHEEQPEQVSELLTRFLRENG